jgi:DNA-binding response OmpR family regulator
MVMPASILVVDDDPNVAEVLCRYLELEGYHVEAAGDGITALALALEKLPDLVVLDLMLPGLDGLEVCRRLRAIAPIPVIMLTARGEESDRIVGLDLGADDYIAKPFSPREVVARVKAVLRRANPSEGAPGTPALEAAAGVLQCGELRVDRSSHQVWRAGQPVALTVREFDLLVFLMSNAMRVFRREELLEHVWGYTYGDTSTVTVHVRRLREKIERHPSAPVHLTTVWGVGYRFDGVADSNAGA